MPRGFVLDVFSRILYSPLSMLIVCAGPDTYHARKRARELVAAFRAKHDPTGYSTSNCTGSSLDDLLSQLGSPSLFAVKRLIRCDGLLEDLKIADVRRLAKRLLADQDQTIVLSVEDEAVPTKIEKEFEGVKIVTYSYSLLTGRLFAAAVASLAQEAGVDAQRAAAVAVLADGDMWIADQEIAKCAANAHYIPLSAQSAASGVSLFDLADAYLRRTSSWRTHLSNANESDGAPMVFSAQARTFLRVTAGSAEGVHPYVVKKMQQAAIAPHRGSSALLSALSALVASRSSLASGDEWQSLL